MATHALDQFNSVGTNAAALVTFKIVHAIQQEKSGNQVAGVANLFLLMCSKFKLNPRDVLNKASHRLYDSFLDEAGRGEHIRAMQMYVNEEIK